jgi:hypothetical protein
MDDQQHHRHQQQQQPAFMQERLGELGELRAYRRPGPPEHVAFEVLRESDGRAWTLRVPWEGRQALRRLLAAAGDRLGPDAPPPDFGEDGCAELAAEEAAAGVQLVAVLLRQDEERAFAVWRREPTRQGGWSWTLDVVVVPGPLARTLCERMLADLDRLDQPSPRRNGAPASSAPGPTLPTPSQPPSASTLSTSRR